MENATLNNLSVVKVIKSNSVMNDGKEFLELGIDALLKPNPIKNILLVNTMIGMFSEASSFRYKFVTKNLSASSVNYQESRKKSEFL